MKMLQQKALEVVSAIRSINNSAGTMVLIGEDKDICFWQRKEWVEWMLELASELEREANSTKIKEESAK